VRENGYFDTFFYAPQMTANPKFSGTKRRKCRENKGETAILLGCRTVPLVPQKQRRPLPFLVWCQINDHAQCWSKNDQKHMLVENVPCSSD